MAQEIRVAAETRVGTGSAEARRLRRAGALPGAVCNNVGESRLIKINLHDFERMLHHHASENLMIDIDLDGKALGKVLLRDVQHHPLTGRVLHVDFVEVSMTEAVRIDMPLQLVGEPVGVTLEGGILEQVLREIEVECLPGDMVEYFEVDVSNLKVGGSLLVRDLKVDDKFTVLTAHDLAIAAVVEPRVEAEPVAAEGEAAEADGAAEEGKTAEAGETAEKE